MGSLTAFNRIELLFPRSKMKFLSEAVVLAGLQRKSYLAKLWQAGSKTGTNQQKIAIPLHKVTHLCIDGEFGVPRVWWNDFAETVFSRLL